MCEKFFVVSDDGVLPRIIAQDTDVEACQAWADQHWEQEADEDELVFVVCNHDSVVAAAQAIAAC